MTSAINTKLGIDAVWQDLACMDSVVEVKGHSHRVMRYAAVVGIHVDMTA